MTDAESERATSQDAIEGRYANYFKVGHNSAEFILEFGQVYVDSDREMLHTRIVTSPLYAGVLLDLLQQSVEKYERAFGPIERGE